MARRQVTQSEFNETLKKVEANTCFRFQAGVDDNSAFMVPVAKDGHVMGPTVRFNWKQLTELAKLVPPPSLRRGT